MLLFKHTEVKKERGGEKKPSPGGVRESPLSPSIIRRGGGGVEGGDDTAHFATPGSHAPVTAAQGYKLVHEVSPGLRLLSITKSSL